MEHTAITTFDLVVFGVLGISGLLSFFRGFIRELLSLGGWLGASLVTVYAFPSVASLLKPHIHNEGIASGFAAIVTFLVALILISIVTKLLMKLFKSGSDIGLLNNFLGLMFGLARGLLLLAVGYFILTIVTADKDREGWAKGSLTAPYIVASSKWVQKVAPTYLDDITTKDVSPDKAVDKAVDNAGDKLDELKDNTEKNWPSMEDLKDKMGNTTGGDD